MLWPQINELAPTGYVLIDNEVVPAANLIHNNYSAISTYITHMARDMVIHKVECIDHNNGQRDRNVLYDVYQETVYRPTHCLNVFGAKMIRDYLEQKEDQNDCRFNYTGLQ